MAYHVEQIAEFVKLEPRVGTPAQIATVLLDQLIANFRPLADLLIKYSDVTKPMATFCVWRYDAEFDYVSEATGLSCIERAIRPIFLPTTSKVSCGWSSIVDRVLFPCYGDTTHFTDKKKHLKCRSHQVMMVNMAGAPISWSRGSDS